MNRKVGSNYDRFVQNPGRFCRMIMYKQRSCGIMVARYDNHQHISRVVATLALKKNRIKIRPYNISRSYGTIRYWKKFVLIKEAAFLDSLFNSSKITGFAGDRILK